MIDVKDFPTPLHPYLKNAEIEDTSGHSSARVYHLSTGAYLKIDQKGRLKQEALLTHYFYEQGLSVAVLDYVSEEKDYLLTQAADGQENVNWEILRTTSAIEAFGQKETKMTQINETDMINEVYNLILNPDLTSKEREVLLTFKEQVEDKKDFEKSLVELSAGLRQIAIQNINEKKELTPIVGDFYKKIATYKEWEKNLARGLSATGLYW